MKPIASDVEPGNERPHRNQTILIVEDSSVQTELLRRALEGAGYRVIAARNGAEGLASAKSHHPAAVVSDINMPVMDGYEMCRAIRQEESLDPVPVVLLTMRSEPEDLIRGLNAGADGYLTKPYDVPALLSRLAALLANPPAPPPAHERRKVKLTLGGETYLVDAHGPRMLNLLISTYQNTVLQNRILATTQAALEDLNRNLEQKVLEQTAAIRSSEERFRSLIENASDLVVVTAADGTVVYVSPSIMRIGGYQAEEVIGKSFLIHAHPDDQSDATNVIKRLLRDPQTPQSSALRFRHREGTWVMLESIARNALDDPAIAGIVINARDVTDRTIANETLRESESRYRSLFQNLLNGYAHCRMIYDDAGRPDDFVYLDVNQSLERISGLENVVGKPVSVVIPGIKELSPELFEAYGRVAATGTPETFDFDFKSKEQWYTISAYSPAPGEFVAVFNDITERKLAEQRNEQQMRQLEIALMQTVGVATSLSGMRDPYTAGHERRVAEIAAAIGAELGFDANRQEGLRVAGLLHDVGKMTIPAEILSKPSRLSAIEFQLINEHARAGYEVLKHVQFPWPVAEVALQHHERMDGSGYPQGLAGEAILLEARITAVADVLEAMSTHRPYRPALGIANGLAEIERGRGTLYDPAVADACLKLFREKGYAIPD